MKKVLIGAAAAGLVFSVSAYAGERSTPSAKVQKQAALYQISLIERTWHKAASSHDLNLMMSIWAPNAVATVGGKTVVGKAAVRELLAKAGPFQSQNRWISETPAYKIRESVNGNQGTLYFECHYVDVETAKVVAVVGADQQVQKLNGKWLITNMAASTATLQP